MADWIGIVGAAAWLPHIATWVWKAATRPQVRLIPSPIPEVGYNLKGPILNVTGALSASRADAVIEKMVAVVRHESGHELALSWAFVSETFSQMQTADGQSAEYHRSQSAVALKVPTTFLVERLLGFQDLQFQEERTRVANALHDYLNHVQRTEPEAAAQLVVKSREFAEYVDLYQRRFPWRAGKYDATVSMYMAERKKPLQSRLSFELSKLDEDRLRGNLSEIARVATEIAQNVPVAERVPAYWAWANPLLRASIAPTRLP